MTLVAIVGAELLESILDAPAREGFDRVLIAGDPERAQRARRSAEGVPVDATTWEQILHAAARLGVDAAQVQRAAAGV